MSLGWYAGKLTERHKTTAAVQQMLQTIESADRVQAARDVQAITLIESGETLKAIRSLCVPIANYCDVYTVRTNDTEAQLRLRVLIQELMQTNRVAAQEISNRMATMKGSRP